MGVLGYGIIELCSAFNSVSKPIIATCWGLAAGISAVFVQYSSDKPWKKYTFFWQDTKHNLLTASTSPNRVQFYLAVGIIILPLFFLSILTPPNNHDAMSYHCARVMHWLQNQNIEHFPTAYAHQLSHTPLAEYLILHFQVLSGGDYFSNIIQFGAMFGSMCLIVLISKQLRLSNNTRVCTLLLALTVPMGLFQATSTQNDYVAAFFLLASVYFGLTQQILWLALAIALGGLTKYTVWIVGFPFYVWFGIVFVSENKLPIILQKVYLSLLLFLVIIAPNMYRNYQTFGNPIGEKIHKYHNTGVVNDRISIENTVANLIHNTSNHLGLPVQKYNLLVDAGIQSTLQHLRISQNSVERNYLSIVPKTTFGFTEDTVGNLWTGWLLLLAVGLGGWQWASGKFQPSANQKWFFLCLLLGYILYAALLKWQPWHARLQLGQTLLSTLIISLVLNRFFSARTVKVIGYGLILCALPIILINKSKPLIYPEYAVRKLLNAPNERIEETLFENLATAGTMEGSVLKENYTHNSGLALYFLRPESTPQERTTLIELLDKQGLYKNQSITAMNRHRALMLNGKNDYQTFEALTDTLKKYNIKNIGLDLLIDFTEYPLWEMIKDKVGNDAQLRYIRYPASQKNTPNASIYFKYRAVVSSYGNTYLKYPESQIAAQCVWPRITLIVLKSPTNQVFTY